MGQGRKGITTQRPSVWIAMVLLLSGMLAPVVQAEAGKLEAKSRETLIRSLNALADTTPKNEFDDMLFALNLMVIDRSGGNPFRPSPVAVAEVYEEVDGLTPAQVIDRSKSLKVPEGMKWLDSLYPLAIRPRPKTQTEVIYSHTLVAALSEALPDLDLHDNVAKDLSREKLRSNVAKLSKALNGVVAQCIQATNTKQAVKAPLADYPQLQSLNRVLDVFADRTSDMEAFIQYRDALTSHFYVHYTTLADRQMCRKKFVPWLGWSPEEERSIRVCAAYDMLNTCMVEMRDHIRQQEGTLSQTPHKGY